MRDLQTIVELNRPGANRRLPMLDESITPYEPERQRDQIDARALAWQKRWGNRAQDRRRANRGKT